MEISKTTYFDLKKKGLTHHQIAETLHIGAATLSRWKKEHGITCYRDDSEYTKLRDAGYKDHQIAQRWGISNSALYQWKKGRGLIRFSYS